MYGSSDPHAKRLLPRLLATLQHRPAGLITDLDGTVAPIVLVPEEARVLPEAIAALDRLTHHLALVGVVTGRTLVDARQMVGLKNLVYVGNHGLEVMLAGRPDVVPEAQPWVAQIGRAIESIVPRLDDPGILVENKGATASLHYRLAADPPRARSRILQAIVQTAEAGELRVEEGRMVVNLLPPLWVTKGSAVTWLAERHGLRSLVFFGDDTTDTHAFKALRVLRESHRVATLAVGVVGPETPVTVREMSDVQVPTPQSVAALLHDLANTLDVAPNLSAAGPRDTLQGDD